MILSLQDLGALGEFLAAIATVITLIYLAKQIKTNSLVARSTLEHHINSRELDRRFKISQDPAFAYFLARDWERFDARSLEDYTRWIHQILAERIDTCPERSRRYFKYLSTTDTLLHYRSTEGISRTVLQMAKRARFNSGMENAGAVLRRQYPQLKEGFESFFPELVRYTLGERRAHA